MKIYISYFNVILIDSLDCVLMYCKISFGDGLGDFLRI